MSYVNEFKLCGDICHIFEGNSCVIVTVRSGLYNPKVVCFGKQAETILANYKLGMKIALRGFAVNSFHRGQRNFSLFCGEILTDYEDYRCHQNFFTFLGEIVHISRSNGYANLMLRVEDGKHIAYLPVSILAAEMGNLELGDTVMAFGEIGTTVKMKDGQRRHYQSLRATHLIPGNSMRDAEKDASLI